MTSLGTPYQVANFVVGVISLAGLLYMLYAKRFVVHYQRFFRIVATGLAIFALTAPLRLVFSHVFIHFVHAIAAFVIAMGFYTLVKTEFGQEESFESAFGTDELD